MAINLNNLQNNISKTKSDLTKATTGERYLLPEGYALARMTEYIEAGLQPQEYAGEAKEPKKEFRIGFSLYGQGYQKEDGSPRSISSFWIAEGNNIKSKCKKLFDMMNYKGTANNFAYFLGQSFMVHIAHKKNSKKETVAVLDITDIRPPLDPLTKKPYDVPEARPEDYRVLLWDAPDMDQWESIQIEKNNFIADHCRAAINYEGSPLQALTGLPAVQTTAPAAPAPAASVPLTAENPVSDEEIPF